MGYSFQGWATSASGTVAYAAGESYTSNAAVTLYAVRKANTYSVTYNANGGSGAPSSQTKTYGITLQLSESVPTRTNYNFLGWGTSPSSTTVSYTAGANYTANSAITLYAIWQLAYIKPRITNLTIDRCDYNATTQTIVKSDQGTYALVKFNWACDKTVTNALIEWQSVSNSGSYPVAVSGLSGTVNQVIGNAEISTDSTYTFTITVTDSGGSSSVIKNLSGIKFTIDYLNGGDGVSFGKPAEIPGFDVNMDARFRKNLCVFVDNVDYGVLHRGNTNKTLWTGSWSTGTITVPDFDKYELFQIQMEGQGTKILAVKHGVNFRGIGGMSTATPTIINFQFNATVSGNDLTLVACNNCRPLDDSYSVTNMTITAIKGII